MLILAFESSAKAASVALAEDGVLLGEYFQNSGQTHSRTLMKLAADLLENCDLSPDAPDAVAVAKGPGSFTGLRIGIAAAKGYAWARELPCIGVSTLEAMARNVAVTDGTYVAVMDARRQQVYNALFSVENRKFNRLCEDRAISLSELAKNLETCQNPKILVGDGAELCYNSLTETDAQLLLLPEHLRHQRAAGVALAAEEALRHGAVPQAAELTPNYLRLSQAERERAERMKKETR